MVRRTAARRGHPRHAATETGRRRRDGDGGDSPPLVLIVDDHEDTRVLYGEFFLHSGYRVDYAIDGEDALAKVSALAPDLVVMDLAMPVVDGWEATLRLKAHAKTADIPVIVLTGHVTGDNLQRAEDAGADAVLTKPCLPQILLDLVKQFLDA